MRVIKSAAILGIRWFPVLIGAASCLGDEVRPAAQIGPSCAFYANIPALTRQTGVDISQATEFIRPIYGLHRGDFRFGSSFDKHKFFELFGLPYKRTEIKHPALAKRVLVGQVEEVIAGEIDAGLAQGAMFSLRVVGAFGGPHNVLLLERRGERYQVHDPFPGVIREYGRKALAEMMLVRSKASKNQPAARYVTHFLTLSAPVEWWPGDLTPAKLPQELEVVLSGAQREQLGLAFRGSGKDGDEGLGGRIERFDELDFAALPPRKAGGAPVNVAGAGLGAKELLGLVRVAQFHLCVWHLGRRDVLPVLFLDGKPQVLTGYRRTPEGETRVSFDDGAAKVELPILEALERIRKDGAMLATVGVKRE
jgi:hypothetical protein